MTATLAPSRAHETGRAAIFGWLLFDWAQQPFFTLVTTFVFAPYFTSQVAASEAEGQALWGLAVGTAGFLIAVLSPVLGAIADAAGRRKLWIAGFSAMLVGGCSALWLAAPGASAVIPLVLAAVVLASIGAEFGIVFTNALMPQLVPPERIGSLSGTGWAFGYAGGLVSLALTLSLLTPIAGTDRTLIGVAPLVAEGERWIGPFSALWFLVFALPFFLFTPGCGVGLPLRRAVEAGFSQLRTSLEGLTGPLFRFLLAHMLYQDGLNALFAFGGIYAAGTFGWGTMEIGAFGILLIVAGTIGAWAGGVLDDRLGPKRVIAGALAMLIIAATLILSIDRESVLFLVPLPGPAGDGLFASPAERIYLALGVLIGLAAGPAQAASRTFLVRLARPEEMTQAFGLFALSGKVTSFAAPLAIAALTAASGSQRVGIAAVLVFLGLGLGFILLGRINGGSGARP